jgi:hypothetical protein
VIKVLEILNTLGADRAFLTSKGLTPDEYRAALPLAIQKVRGSGSAQTADKRSFLRAIFDKMLEKGLISDVQDPEYGQDTVYRLTAPGFGDIAIIQKGCPDGAHSSLNWSAPEWAKETYLWWLCSSLSYEPGVHVAKGINRLRQRFFTKPLDVLDGVIFHNEMCGSSGRPCPKQGYAIEVGGQSVPPPCVFVMPRPADGVNEWNWNGRESRYFPKLLLSLFGIDQEQSPSFIGSVGFQKRGGNIRVSIGSASGPGLSTSYRS